MGAALHHGLTLPVGANSWVKGGWIHNTHTYPSDMAQGFWTAIFAFSICFIVTIVVSLLTEQKKADSELRGLVYSLTPRVKEHGLPWYKQPAALGILVLLAVTVLNIIFW